MEVVGKKGENPFAGYLKRLQEQEPKKKINPIHEIVNTYYKWTGNADKHKMFYRGRWGYGKLAKEAKELYTACGENLDDAMWSLDRMKYKAEKGGFDWSIRTCLKHKLRY